MEEEIRQEEENKNKKKKHLLYRLFNPEGNGKGVQKVPEGPDNIAKCFKLIGRNITNLFYLNLIFIIGNFPLMFALYALSGNVSTPSTAASSSMFGPLYGIMNFENSPVTAALFGVHGIQARVYESTVWTYVFFALAGLVIFTFGYVNTGITYVMRSMLRGEPISIFADMKDAIKRNKKQGFILGVIDVAIIGLLIYDITFFYYNMQQFFVVNLIIICLYCMMRYYMYVLMITFDLSIWKIIKNSLILTLLGFKRNIMALLGSLILLFITYMLIGIIMPVGIIIPFFILFSLSMFFGLYAAYPKIKEVMIDPQLAHSKPKSLMEDDK